MSLVGCFSTSSNSAIGVVELLPVHRHLRPSRQHLAPLPRIELLQIRRDRQDLDVQRLVRVQRVELAQHPDEDLGLRLRVVRPAGHPLQRVRRRPRPAQRLIVPRRFRVELQKLRVQLQLRLQVLDLRERRDRRVQPLPIILGPDVALPLPHARSNT